MDVRFRRAIIGDAAAMCALNAECFGDPPPFEDVELVIRSNQASCHICHFGTELVGCTWAVNLGHHWRLSLVSVAPKWRRSKYGTGLLARLGRDLPSGVLLSAFVNECNYEGIKFLDAVGFTPLKSLRRPSGGDVILFIIRRCK